MKNKLLSLILAVVMVVGVAATAVACGGGGGGKKPSGGGLNYDFTLKTSPTNPQSTAVFGDDLVFDTDATINGLAHGYNVPDESKINGVLVMLSGGTFKDGSMIKDCKAGSSVSIKAQAKLGENGKEDTFVRWFDAAGNELSTQKSFTFQVPNDGTKIVTIYGEWAWYGKAAKYPQENDKLVIYKEYNGEPGPEDNVVKAFIEKKFKDDTGYSVNLVIEAGSTSTLSTKVAGELANKNGQIDFLTNHWGSDSPIDAYLKSPIMTITADNILLMADNFRKAYYASDEDKMAYYTGVYKNEETGVYEVKGISDISANAQWGMIMNATFLNQLPNAVNSTEYAEQWAEAFPMEEFPDQKENLAKYFDIGLDGYKNMTLDQFRLCLLVSKATILKNYRPFNAAGWEFDYLISPALEGVAYGGFQMDDDGDIIPSYATEGYEAVFEFQRWMQEHKLWYEDPSSAGADDFYAGKNLVCSSWPDAKSLIKQAGLLADQGYESIVLAPLANDEGVVNGFKRNATAFSGGVMFAKSKQEVLFARYLNWVYTPNENGDFANIELCTYGVEGKHWIKGEEDPITGRIKYAYPADKAEEYYKLAPTSGLFYILGNVNLTSGRYIYDGYTDRELTWTREIANFKTWSGEERDIDGVLYGGTGAGICEGVNMPPIKTTSYNLVKQQQEVSDQYQAIRGAAWSIKQLPEQENEQAILQARKDSGDKWVTLDTVRIQLMHEKMVNQLKTTASDLLTYYRDNFEESMEFRTTGKRVGEE